MPRAGLDRATVTAAASERADEVGFAGPAMGLPAERAGVRAEAAIGGPDTAPLHAGEGS
ncbi:hypothetical protein [Streptomyces sp. NPDC086777]|uniref:hypothetical protein n=1 Tax=Streptomyces sp. NPDC086777 TaxID=3154866 RepID=UPI00344BEE69